MSPAWGAKNHKIGFCRLPRHAGPGTTDAASDNRFAGRTPPPVCTTYFKQGNYMNSKIFSTFTRLMLRLVLGMGAASMTSTAYATAAFDYWLDTSVSVYSGYATSTVNFDDSTSYADFDSSGGSSATADAGVDSTGAWISGSGTANPGGYASAGSDAFLAIDLTSTYAGWQEVILKLNYEWGINVSADDIDTEYAESSLSLYVDDGYFGIDEFVLDIFPFGTPDFSSDGGSGYANFHVGFDGYETKRIEFSLFGDGYAESNAKVPEPSSLVLLFAGLLGFCWFTRTAKHQQQAPLIA